MNKIEEMLLTGARCSGKTVAIHNALKDQEALKLIIKHNLDTELISLCKSYGIYKAHCKRLFLECYINKEQFLLLKEVIKQYE